MLTAAQLKARQGKLTASRVAPLMRGDPVAIDHLYRVMIGEAQEDDLSDVWPVQRGNAMEPLMLNWYQRKFEVPVLRRGEVVSHYHHDWAAATLDGWIDSHPAIIQVPAIMDQPCVVECKSVGGREPIETIVERYQPQMQWQMIVTVTDWCVLYIDVGGNSEPIPEYVPRDEAYGKELLRRGAQFIECVRARRPPVELPPVPPPIDPNKVYDMTGNNFWSSQADAWLRNRVQADIAKIAEKALKEVVPADAKKCSGHGVRITRDRAGRLSLRPDA